jgi:hypothetical protein
MNLTQTLPNTGMTRAAATPQRPATPAAAAPPAIAALGGKRGLVDGGLPPSVFVVIHALAGAHTAQPIALAAKPSSVTRRYDRLARRLGINTTLHKLRHYSATELIAAGVDTYSGNPAMIATGLRLGFIEEARFRQAHHYPKRSALASSSNRFSKGSISACIRRSF